MGTWDTAGDTATGTGGHGWGHGRGHGDVPPCPALARCPLGAGRGQGTPPFRSPPPMKFSPACRQALPSLSDWLPPPTRPPPATEQPIRAAVGMGPRSFPRARPNPPTAHPAWGRGLGLGGAGRSGQGRAGAGRDGQEETGTGRDRQEEEAGTGRDGQKQAGGGRDGQGQAGGGKDGQGRTGAGRDRQDPPPPVWRGPSRLRLRTPEACGAGSRGGPCLQHPGGRAGPPQHPNTPRPACTSGWARGPGGGVLVGAGWGVQSSGSHGCAAPRGKAVAGALSPAQHPPTPPPKAAPGAGCPPRPPPPVTKRGSQLRPHGAQSKSRSPGPFGAGGGDRGLSPTAGHSPDPPPPHTHTPPGQTHGDPPCQGGGTETFWGGLGLPQVSHSVQGAARAGPGGRMRPPEP